MIVKLDISAGLVDQFRSAFGQNPMPGLTGLELDADLGVGRMTLVELPNGLEFYHYTSNLRRPLEITTTNPSISRWFGLNINLDDTGLQRQVGPTSLTIQRSSPSGILVHTPGSVVSGVNPPHRPSESVFLRFSVAFLHEYAPTLRDCLCPAHGAALVEDLDYRSELLLRDAIRLIGNRIHLHSRLLEFMGLFLKKLARREFGGDAEYVPSQDMRGLFRAAARLRDPITSESLSVGELARLAAMGTTKFKTSFSAVFGVAPLRYHHKVKMEFAYDKLVAGRTSPTEVSYELGYSHPSKFTAAFKKHFGQLPSQVHGERIRP